MQAPLHVDGVFHGMDSLLVFCAGCTHSEFIHGDRGARGCLYSDCGCASFEATVGETTSTGKLRQGGGFESEPPQGSGKGVGVARRRVREA
jgi:hypothetical protein